MPNHVTTRCIVTGPVEQVDHFKSVLFDNCERPFDFELLKPMPPLLLRVISPVRTGRHGRTMLNDPADENSWNGIEATSAEQEELDKLSSTDWYDWSIKNWGTKWNAYSVEVADDCRPFTFKFETAWEFPSPIFQALTERFPALTFDCVTFDEGWNFAGRGQFGASVTKAFHRCEATRELYREVYGEWPPSDDEEA